MTSLRDRLAAALAPRYLLERELASGGMGVVYVGQDPRLGRAVAIKVLPPERATAVAVERFVRESRLLAQLAHPHIVPILEAEQQGDLLWFVMPLIAGNTLATRLITEGPLSEPVVRRLGLELLDALAHSHRAGVIHRDIKPANVFLQGEHALLADFGVASLAESTTNGGLTGAGESVGTPSYMAPEQQAGGPITDRTDLYAVGATLYEALTGRQWRSSESAGTNPWRDVPKQMIPVLRRALERDPQQRWPSATTFAAALGPRRIRRSVQGLIAVGALLTLGASWWVGGSIAPAEVPRRGIDDVAFVRFTGGSDSLRDDIPRAVAVELERFQRINLVPWDPPVTAVVAHPRVSRFIVGGRIESGADDKVSMQVTVRNPDGELVDDFRFVGADGGVAQWAAAIADSLVRHHFADDLVEYRQMATSRPNLQALQHYFAGQDHFQRDEWSDAVKEFQAAQRIDSTLVLAAWHELIALKWERLPFEERMAELARHADRLPRPLDALLRVQMRTDLRARMAGFDSLADEYPRYAVVQQMRDNELFHRGPLIGRSLRDGLTAWQGGASDFAKLDQPDSYAHTVWGALRLGDEGVARAQLAAHQRVAPKGNTWGPLLALAVDSRYAPLRAKVRRALLRQFADSGTVHELERAVRLGLQLDDPDDQLALGAILAARGASTDAQIIGESAIATANLLVGRLDQARAALQRATAQVALPDSGLLIQTLEWPLLLPYFGVDVSDGDRDAARRALPPYAVSTFWGPRVAWALAVDGLLRGDTLVAAKWRARLQQAATQGDTLATSLLPLLDAQLRGSRKESREALRLSEAIYLDPATLTVKRRGPFVRAVTYYGRAQWQLELGKKQEAEAEWRWHENNDLQGWPTGEPQEGELDAALSAIARLRRADNLISLGEVATGCGLLRRVAQLWQETDRGFSTLRHELARQLARCP